MASGAYARHTIGEEFLGDPRSAMRRMSEIRQFRFNVDTASAIAVIRHINVEQDVERLEIAMKVFRVMHLIQALHHIADHHLAEVFAHRWFLQIPSVSGRATADKEIVHIGLCQLQDADERTFTLQHFVQLSHILAMLQCAQNYNLTRKCRSVGHNLGGQRFDARRVDVNLFNLFFITFLFFLFLFLLFCVFVLIGIRILLLLFVLIRVFVLLVACSRRRLFLFLLFLFLFFFLLFALMRRHRILVAVMNVSVHTHMNRRPDEIAIIAPRNQRAFARQPSLGRLQQLPALQVQQIARIGKLWITQLWFGLSIVTARRMLVRHGRTHCARIFLIRRRLKLHLARLLRCRVRCCCCCCSCRRCFAITIKI
mmetsp:Transcript_49281/g.81959  ORF Transcript_49281/g.81959 Transcript_49281/m.81959 type:complete len:368 (+) Transcript_49281:1020-2123(+)